MIADETIELGDEIQIGDMGFKFDYHTSESIDVKALYQMVVEGKVPLDSFCKSVYVNKDTASKLIGDHVLRGITKEKIGNRADIRIRDLDEPVAKPKIVRKPPPSAPKKKRLLTDTDERPVANVSNGGRPKPRRRINVQRR
jgi:hypothetical protein